MKKQYYLNAACLFVAAARFGVRAHAKMPVFDTVKKTIVVSLLDSQQAKGKQLIVIKKIKGYTFYTERAAALTEMDSVLANFVEPIDKDIFERWMRLRNYVKTCKGNQCDLDTMGKKERVPAYNQVVVEILSRSSGWVYNSAAKRLERIAYIEDFITKSSRVNPDWGVWGKRVRINNQVVISADEGEY